MEWKFELQELHRRRLQVKSKSKFHKKSKVSTTSTEYSSVANLKSDGNNNSSVHQDTVPAESATKKRQKLFWGLDTKERWERKANM
ncbi:uncharacterized protein LOC123197809 isoform X4 [Mangifera indica]|uniref:uncharacterized protein LOC123197809 isoform X4 n=1 Tax=Mangifera indica TaxID=29780 RepID=UPI001CF9E48F|nr:uncharacterized protein LOC123197809 isoform X4 [Mangifera indica]